MKKLATLAFGILFLSCSSNEDSPNTNPSNDLIIGKWKLTKEVFYLTAGSSVERTADACENQSNFQYHSNNTYSTTSYSDNGTGCELDADTYEYANWQNLGDHNYKFVSKISGQSEETTTVPTVFEDNNNTLIMISNSAGVYNGQSFSSSKEYYQKITN